MYDLVSDTANIRLYSRALPPKSVCQPQAFSTLSTVSYAVKARKRRCCARHFIKTDSPIVSSCKPCTFHSSRAHQLGLAQPKRAFNGKVEVAAVAAGVGVVDQAVVGVGVAEAEVPVLAVILVEEVGEARREVIAAPLALILLSLSLDRVSHILAAGTLPLHMGLEEAKSLQYLLANCLLGEAQAGARVLKSLVPGT